jgi:hypothetical protein
MNAEIKVETRFTKDMIEVSTLSDMDGMHSVIVRRVIELQDLAVRQALIALGWRPPVEIQVEHLPADDTEGGAA